MSKKKFYEASDKFWEDLTKQMEELPEIIVTNSMRNNQFYMPHRYESEMVSPCVVREEKYKTPFEMAESTILEGWERERQDKIRGADRLVSNVSQIFDSLKEMNSKYPCNPLNIKLGERQKVVTELENSVRDYILTGTPSDTLLEGSYGTYSRAMRSTRLILGDLHIKIGSEIIIVDNYCLHSRWGDFKFKLKSDTELEMMFYSPTDYTVKSFIELILKNVLTLTR